MSALLLSSPSPLVGEGGVGGREADLSNDGCGKLSNSTRHLNPSPQGGGES
jgi:hypothetical protein